MVNDFLNKYPRTKIFLQRHPEMDLDEALDHTEMELKKLENEQRSGEDAKRTDY